MAERILTDGTPDGASTLRNEPVQARSTARLASLLDAAAAVIDEIGYERLTTAMVAERAGASIGTVYRYFPDRIVLLQNLSARSLVGFVERTRVTLFDQAHASWWDAVSAIILDMVAAFQSEPGYRSLRLGDVLDVRPTPALPGSSVVGELIATALTERFDLPSDDLAFRLEIVITLVDALLSRAFAIEARGNKRVIAEASSLARAYLTGFYGEPAKI